MKEEIWNLLNQFIATQKVEYSYGGTFDWNHVNLRDFANFLGEKLGKQKL